jgi:hypothetical protein
LPCSSVTLAVEFMIRKDGASRPVEVPKSLRRFRRRCRCFRRCSLRLKYVSSKSRLLDFALRRRRLDFSISRFIRHRKRFCVMQEE